MPFDRLRANGNSTEAAPLSLYHPINLFRTPVRLRGDDEKLFRTPVRRRGDDEKLFRTPVRRRGDDDDLTHSRLR